VLEPLVEIAPDIVIPGAGPAKQRLQDCAGQDVERLA
jgi:7,8-dihydro-6-hydroxymethylpterin-pyrophosphokinase